MSLVMLGNDKISEVNIDTDAYMKSIKPVITLVENEFKALPENHIVGLTVISHKDRSVDYKIYANPKLDRKREEALMKNLKNISVENTKLLDFGIMIVFNAKKDNPLSFDGVEFFEQKRAREFKAAPIEQKYVLTKKWAAEEVLPVLGAYQVIVDDKFAGVKGFGKLVSVTDFSKIQDVDKLTSQNQDYWRAVMEMEPSNQLIPITKLFMLVSQGYFDSARRYGEILIRFSQKENPSTLYLEEFMERIEVFDKEVNQEISKGIAEHDKGNYKKAIAVYDELLKKYPHSAWCNYEVFYSRNALGVQKGTVEAGGRSDWDLAKKGIYKCDPLYNMDVRASTGKELFLMLRRREIAGLFKSDDKLLKDVYNYADIALDLGVNDFAAQFFWISFTFENEGENTKALNRYLYTLEKMGVPQIKLFFKDDYATVFKDIDRERQKLMEESEAYKMMAK